LVELFSVYVCSKDTLVYADPPYLGSTRNQVDRKYYNCELLTEKEHTRLLSVLTGLQCMVMVSHPHCALYDRELLRRGWRFTEKWTITRGGIRYKEVLWMNFPEPVFFHDTRFTGSDFTDRQHVKRKAERWQRKFVAMSAGERAAVLDALNSVVDRPQSKTAAAQSTMVHDRSAQS